MAEKRQPSRKPRDFKGRDKKADTFKTHEKKQQEKPQSAQEEVTGEMIAGKNPVLEALRSGREINKLWIAEGVKKTGVQELMDLAKEQGVLVQFVPKQKVDKLAENHQGIVASVAAYDYAELDDLFNVAKAKNEDPFFLILDELEDPHNLGSIMRTADAIGAHGIIIPKRRAVGLTAVVAKASTGAIEHVPVVRVTNLAQTVDELKDRGVWIAGTDAKGSADYRKMDATLPLALIIGSEGKGMSRLLKDKCDFLYHLPMVGHVTSLNASVAAALLMYEVYRKRQEANG
ncbi:23S rRNA (guanosine2251-2'-O)-methyltransferase [Solibacillus kalamii]|uniref:23S rRNA (Guanosine(2251)-2'-O)-methyltransferase RlmB n=1 Tax=Solibacillus kalamii TaxID=1748298 RepID=A0ABX3ZF65_9BACL|nr:23S rRNA (guanosine(2251)-2'-O)-methyltransferase RlmB [Solibacillus kalamii]MBM7666189.1 23S rRNA (guanosine2251-2'-O)-methyltransferase [Solibacillus kalamii]OUZ38345.1 23S rRNA (guanosine(2251)-2'-O)-methyltransferase RlmB [Solibacillus kalamii]